MSNIDLLSRSEQREAILEHEDKLSPQELSSANRYAQRSLIFFAVGALFATTLGLLDKFGNEGADWLMGISLLLLIESVGAAIFYYGKQAVFRKHIKFTSPSGVHHFDKAAIGWAKSLMFIGRTILVLGLALPAAALLAVVLVEFLKSS